MTEKRFTLAYEKGNWWAVRDGDITLWKEEVISLLNDFHEENEQLKQDIEYLEEKIKENEWHWNTIDEDRDVWHYKCTEAEKRVKELKIENEQLKSDNKEYIKGLDLAQATSQSWASDVRELREENCRLEKKNERLIKKIKRERASTTKQHLKWSDEAEEIINDLRRENKELKLQNGELLYQIGEVGKNNKTCRECECFIPEDNICYMWDMEVEADDVVVACDQRKVKK